MAQSAVEDYLTSVSENTLLKEQDSVDIRGLRRELLENALKYYQRFVSQRSNDPLLRRELANAYFRVGRDHARDRQASGGDRGVSIGGDDLGVAHRG